MNFDMMISVPYIWDVLSRETRPILLYGTGNGADKILDVMERRHIPCSGVFASDGFVRSRDFRGMQVKSYSAVREAFGDGIVILCAFGSPRDEVLDFLAELDSRHDLYVPDVPLFCGDLEAELFSPEYALSHREMIECAAELMSDEYSRELYWEILAYRLSGRLKYLSRTESFADSVRSCVPADVRRVIDGGAFNGDTARVFLDVFGDRLGEGSVVCIEPDPRTFRKLSAFAESESRCVAVNGALGDFDGVTEFMSSASRASTTGQQNKRAKSVEIPAVTVDSVVRRWDGVAGSDDADGALDADGRLLIKLDVEGAERAAILGAAETVAAVKPAFSASVYHRTEDIFAIPIMLHEMNEAYRFRLRRVRCVPAWEITLFAE